MVRLAGSVVVGRTATVVVGSAVVVVVGPGRPE